MALSMPETRYARSGDVNIAYQIFGEGETALVWIPGFAQHLELNWEEPYRRSMFEELARFARVVILDKRGTGTRCTSGLRLWARGRNGSPSSDRPASA